MTIDEIVLSLDDEIERLQQARALLAGYAEPNLQTKRGPGRPKKASSLTTPPKTSTKRRLSEEARKRIAAAQHKRWAAKKKSVN